MVLREVKPLNAEQWKQVTTALKAGSTPEQKQFMVESIERAKKMKEIKD